jgi:Glycosyltransferase
MKKVLFIAYYFPPLGWSGVQRTIKFVKYLRNFNWEPIIVTVGDTKFRIKDESLLREIPNETQIVRIDDVFFKSVTDKLKDQLLTYTETSFNLIADDIKNQYLMEVDSVLEKLRNLMLLPDGNAIWANEVIKEIENKIKMNDIDMIYTTSAPYSSHIIGYHLKEKLGLPWVADFRDEWTNNADMDYKDELRFSVEREIEKKVVNFADNIITTTPLASQNYIDIFALNKNKVYTITNGYDESDFEGIKSHKNDKFTIVHSGSLYLSRVPFTFINAVDNLIDKKLLDKNHVQIIFAGKNENIIEQKVMDICKNKDIIDFKGYLPHNESINLIMSASVLLLTLGNKEKAKAIFPGKIFEYLRCKKPIISLSPKDSVVDILLEETKCGINVEYDDIEDIENSILKFYNDWINNKPFIVNEKEIKKYERKKLTQKLVKVFNGLI